MAYVKNTGARTLKTDLGEYVHSRGAPHVTLVDGAEVTRARRTNEKRFYAFPPGEIVEVPDRHVEAILKLGLGKVNASDPDVVIRVEARPVEVASPPALPAKGEDDDKPPPPPKADDKPPPPPRRGGS